MKRILALLLLLVTMSVQAAYVLWFGLDETSIVHYEDGSTKFIKNMNYDTEANTLRLSEWDSSMNFVMYLTLYYQDPDTGTWYDDAVEMDTLSYDEQTGEVKGLADWQPVKLGDVSPSERRDHKVKVELGYVDMTSSNPDEWGEFEMLAFAYATLGEIDDGEHVYPTFTLAPPIETPWRPIDFYTYETIIPEPSTCTLFLVGTVLLFRKNRTSQRT